MLPVTLDNFEEYIRHYEEDELFYKDLYLHEKEHPETFPDYLESLDPDYIRQHELYVPALHTDPWVPYMHEKNFFLRPGDIQFSKHFRYTPAFVHEHEFFEIFCVWDGTADTQIQGIQHHLQTGDILIIPPGTRHSVSIFNDSIAFNLLIRSSTFQSTFFPMIANKSALSQFFSHVLFHNTKGNYLIFHTHDDTVIRNTLKTLYVEYLGRGKYKNAFLNSLLSLFWAQLLRNHDTDIESILIKGSNHNSITRILEYITENYQTVTLKEAATHFGYSVTYFSTLIKECTGQTFLQITKEIKLGQARRALSETSLNINSICELVGYESPEYFMRLFKKVYGMTPGEYRRLHRE